MAGSKDRIESSNKTSSNLLESAEQLDLSVSLLRAMAACPSLFDNINTNDRQNLLLLALEHAEAAQEQLKKSI